LKIGLRIREARKALKISQIDFSKGLTISQASLSEIEREKMGISLATFEKLVYTYNISPFFLLRGEGEMFMEKGPVQDDEPAPDLNELASKVYSLESRIIQLEQK